MRLQFFRGHRTYLHSATLLQYIHHKLAVDPSECKQMDFACRKITDRICRLVNYTDAPSEATRIVAEYQDTIHHILVLESEKPLLVRVPYNETDITSRCLFDRYSAVIVDEISGYTIFDCLVAVYKHLLLALFPGKKQSFIFIRTRLEKMPELPVKITFDRLISNRYYQATVFSAGSKCGMIIYGDNS